MDPVQNNFPVSVPSMPPPAPKSKKKLLIIGAIVAAVLILAVAGVVFGYYLPNRPENVWKASVNRTGKALDELVDRSTQQERLDSFRKSDVQASMTANVGEATYSGSLDVKYDEVKTNGQLVIAAEGDNIPDNSQFKVSFMSELAEGRQYPTVHLLLTGLKSFGLDSYLPPAMVAYEGKWIKVDSEYLAGMASFAPDAAEDQQELSSEDIAELVNAVRNPTVDRVFSTDSDKAVFENRGFVKKEKIDGKETYQYKVGINKANVRNYCKALVESVMSTNAYKELSWVNMDTYDEDKARVIKECDDMDLDNIKDNDTFDVWVDKKYKLIYKARINDRDSQDVYYEIGQNYTGGDDATLFVNFHDGSAKTDARYSMTVNTVTSTTDASLTYENKGSDDPIKLSFELSAKPLAGEIEVVPPVGAVLIQDILKQIGVDPTLQL